MRFGIVRSPRDYRKLSDPRKQHEFTRKRGRERVRTHMHEEEGILNRNLKVKIARRHRGALPEVTGCVSTSCLLCSRPASSIAVFCWTWLDAMTEGSRDGGHGPAISAGRCREWSGLLSDSREREREVKNRLWVTARPLGGFVTDIGKSSRSVQDVLSCERTRAFGSPGLPSLV